MRIQYAEGDNYNFGATQYVNFTVKKENVLTIKNIIGPDGNPIAGITDSTLGIKFGEDRKIMRIFDKRRQCREILYYQSSVRRNRHCKI